MLTGHDEHACGIEIASASIPAEEHFEDLSHHAGHCFLAGHLVDLFLLEIVRTEESLAADPGNGHQVQHVAQFAATASADLGSSAPFAALSLAQIQSGVPHELGEGLEIVGRTDLGHQSREQTERDDSFLPFFGKFSGSPRCSGVGTG